MVCEATKGLVGIDKIEWFAEKLRRDNLRDSDKDGIMKLCDASQRLKRRGRGRELVLQLLTWIERTVRARSGGGTCERET